VPRWVQVLGHLRFSERNRQVGPFIMWSEYEADQSLGGVAVGRSKGTPHLSACEGHHPTACGSWSFLLVLSGCIRLLTDQNQGVLETHAPKLMAAHAQIHFAEEG